MNLSINQPNGLPTHYAASLRIDPLNAQKKSREVYLRLIVLLIAISCLGCAAQNPFSNRDRELNHVVYDQAAAKQTLSADQRIARLTGDAPFQAKSPSPNPNLNPNLNHNPVATANSNPNQDSRSAHQLTSALSPRATSTPPASQSTQPITVRTQSPDNNGFGFPPRAQTSATAKPGFVERNQPNDNSFVAQASQSQSGSAVKPATYQYPELSSPGAVTPSFGVPSPNIGAPNEQNPIVQPFERGGNAIMPQQFPQNYADIDVYVEETQTGKINFGGAYNSDNGIVGQFIIDERNFDIRRFPRSFRDVWDGTAWRGGGQTFRLELVPGAVLQRYLVSFSEPYFLNTDFSFSASGYFFQRQYFDWTEERLGGRFSIGRRLDPFISVNAGVRLESVNVEDPRVNTSAQLNEALGNSNLFVGNIGLVRDTRNNPFLATKGTFFSAMYSQAFGDYDFPRGDIDYRRYRLMYERPDGSGQHTISYGTKLGFSGSSTPIFENYFAGGFSTMRGFDFRGAAPLENGVRVGGEFQWLNTVEYMFPLTADDMIKGVMFCDFGTVEEGIEINKENFRVAPGFGFRIHMPAAGIGAPLAFDFAFPVATADGDDERIFSFYLGVLR